MKRLSVLLVIFICIGVVLWGRYSYQEKLSSTAASAQAEREQTIAEQKQVQEEMELARMEEEQQHFQALTSGVEPSISQRIEDLYFGELAEEDAINILAFGSKALVDSQNEGIDPWPVLLERELNEGYGKTMFNVETVALGDNSSIEVLQNGLYQDVVNADTNIVIFEPFLWNSNSGVDITHTLDSMEIIISAFYRDNPDILLYVQPSQPVYDTYFYPQQEEQLKEFATTNGYQYIDFWQDWPSVDSEDILQYVHSEHNMPTQAGHELWSKSIERLFINHAAIEEELEE
ncbi:MULTISPECIES: SGNH/GDSL hydrolase family protein [Bacillaceae]|uniref:SGNH/GDSL hydrolase family protein n=1 Tax=Evansella alkalicola TaxID=745819 RepID=A0ABS6JVU2_9BACI|nr:MULTISPECIES: SGNH/GDSL hydrolase family protein [Bacillaceae]MBU9722702.1 SGNH/GDSL hydrolase family protein [Bacillus alkalicola]